MKYVDSKNKKVKVTRGVRNKNPFNIKRNDHNQWRGKVIQSAEIPLDKDFEVFDSMGFGVRAGMYLSLRYIIDFDCFDLNSFIHRFCPDSPELEKKYVRFIQDYCANSLVDLSSMSYPQFIKMMRAICLYESNYFIPDSIIRVAYNALPDRFKEFFEHIV